MFHLFFLSLRMIKNMGGGYKRKELMNLNKILKYAGILIVIFLVVGIISGHIDISPKKANQSNATVVEINQSQFAELIFDFEKGGEWKFSGDKPVVIDFYATWCGPCKRLRPRLEQLASEYGDQIIVYSIDAELAPHLSAYMGVDRFPTVFFVPLEGIPYKSVGLIPLYKLRKGVEKILEN